MAHRAVSHSLTRYSPFYLLYGWEKRLPTEDDLTAEKFGKTDYGDQSYPIKHHVETLADRLTEAYRVVK
jgi:hypothetical protein